jgi:hypothetical protein
MAGRKPARAPDDPLCKNKWATRAPGWQPRVGDVVVAVRMFSGAEEIGMIIGLDAASLSPWTYTVAVADGSTEQFAPHEMRLLVCANQGDPG